MKIKLKGKEYTIREFFKRWKWGIENLTPRQRLASKLQGSIGMVCAFIFASTMIYITGTWYYIPIFVFAGWLQVLDIINTWQQYKLSKSIELNIGSTSKTFEEAITEKEEE